MQHLILLHGALGSKDQLQPLATALERHFQVHIFNFSGHGGRPFPDKNFVLLGDRDKMVTLDETLAVYKQLPNAQCGVLPGTPHAFEQVNIPLLAQLIKEFLK